jgi:hypothetical protein
MAMHKAANIKSWLRRSPQPASIRIVSGGESRQIAIPHADPRKWAIVEETINAADPEVVEALDAGGAIIRGLERKPAEDDEDETGETASEAKADLAIARRAVAKASMLDKYGQRLNEAYEKGAHAGAQGSEQVVTLCSMLMQHFSNLMTSFHETNLKVAELVQELAETKGEKESSPAEQLIGQIGAAVAMKGLGAGENGASKKKEGL